MASMHFNERTGAMLFSHTLSEKLEREKKLKLDKELEEVEELKEELKAKLEELNELLEGIKGGE